MLRLVKDPRVKRKIHFNAYIFLLHMVIRLSNKPSVTLISRPFYDQAVFHNKSTYIRGLRERLELKRKAVDTITMMAVVAQYEHQFVRRRFGFSDLNFCKYARTNTLEKQRCKSMQVLNMRSTPVSFCKTTQIDANIFTVWPSDARPCISLDASLKSDLAFTCTDLHFRLVKK